MPTDLTALDAETLATLHEDLTRQYARLSERGLSLDLTRGKPSPEQLDLADDLLSLPGGKDPVAADGSDCRNYGGLAGLLELREIFSPLLQVPAAQLLAGDNSSLGFMHDTLIHAMLFTLPGGERRWVEEDGPVAFLCPVPGYDRHFALCEKFGITMIPVDLGPSGPDMDEVERLAAADPRIKGIWCVPKYGNPTGVVYDDDTVRRLAAMPTAAPDFRIFWDDAYAVHHLTDHPARIAPLLELCERAGNPDRAFVFGSTSKVTFAGSGVSFFGASPANVAWLSGQLSRRTIGPDKLNQLRHVLFFGDPAGVLAQMERHREILQPKFETVQRILGEQLGGTGVAQWSNPAGGYFVCLEVPDGCASRVVELAKGAGVALTPAGATHPHGVDPRDRTIRLAPTYPTVDQVEAATRAVATCVLLASVEALTASRV
jgi:DNA-binding transcriptional MocR family regulator